MKGKKRFASLAIMLAMALVVTAVMPSAAIKAEAATRKYLVLVQDKNGNWTGYNNLAYKSTSGGIMVPAKKISSKLGLVYKSTGKGKFTISKGNTKICAYTRGKKGYSYTKSGVKATKTAKYAPELHNKENCLYSLGMTAMVYSAYYKASGLYKDSGYSGVVCYSGNGKISALPETYEVVNAEKLGMKVNPYPNGFEAHGLKYYQRSTLIEEMGELARKTGQTTVNINDVIDQDYVTSTEDGKRKVYGAAWIGINDAEYRKFISDETHMKQDGYEWTEVSVFFHFVGENAEQVNSVSFDITDYYDMDGYSASSESTEMGGKYSVKWNGKEYDKCCWEFELTDDSYWEEEGVQHYGMTLQFSILAPVDYDGTVIVLMDNAIEMNDNQPIYEVADENTMFFRLK